MPRKSAKEVISELGKDGIGSLFLEMTMEHYAIYGKYLARTPPRHLDIGSGDGMAALNIKEQKKIAVSMIDLYADSLSEKVRRRLQEDSQFDHTVYKAGSDLPFPEDHFGSVSLFYVLHHCPTREDALQLLVESKRVLDNNGHLIVLEEVIEKEDDQVYFLEMDLKLSKMFYPALFSGKGVSYEPAHFFREDGKVTELTDIFRKAGFKLVKSVKPQLAQYKFPRTLYVLGNANRPNPYRAN